MVVVLSLIFLLAVSVAINYFMKKPPSEGLRGGTIGRFEVVNYINSLNGRILLLEGPVLEGLVGVRNHDGTPHEWNADTRRKDRCCYNCALSALEPTDPPCPHGPRCLGMRRPYEYKMWEERKS